MRLALLWLPKELQSQQGCVAGSRACYWECEMGAGGWRCAHLEMQLRQSEEAEELSE